MIPKFDTTKELHAYLIANKANLVDAKKGMIKHTQPITHSIMANTVTKSVTDIEDNADSFNVKVVANSAMVLDSDMDVLITGCYDETVKERKDITPHLHDHIHKIEAKIGEVSDIYTEAIGLDELGMSKVGSTECLIFETEVIKSYNEQVFNQYKSGRINQHSIGLNYDDLKLAVNDEDDPEAKTLYDQYIGKILNPEKAIEKGFFWVVKKITLLENSAVLFGSNHATPTLSSDIKVVKEEKTKPNLLKIRRGLFNKKHATK